MTELSQLQSQIDRADCAYYRPGNQPIMSDQRYDALKAQLRVLNPTDSRLTRVGAPYAPEELGSKLPHRIPMGSLDNTKHGILGVQTWFDRLEAKLRGVDGSPIPLVASHKMDGLAVELIYDQLGQLTRVISRGNGLVGEDLTANAVRFQGVPTVLPIPLACTVRGEAMLHRAQFQLLTAGRPPAETSNPRNVASGIVGRDSGRDCDLIQFYAYNLLTEADQPGSEVVKFALLQGTLGFTVAPYRPCASVAELIEFYYYTLQQRTTLPYDIDGIVATLDQLADQNWFVTSDPNSRMRPKYARAIKFPAYSAETVLEGITVTVGHTGQIIPTAQLRPVPIGGLPGVKSALLTNYDEPRRLEVAIGDRVEVALAGDIIPKLIRKVADGVPRQPIVEPTHCPGCGTATTRQSRGKEGANLYCVNQACPAIAIGKIDAFIGTSKKGVGILDIGDQTIKALWDQELVSDPADLYTLTPEVLAEVRLDSGGRIGLSRARRVVANIQAKRTLPLHVFLGSLGVELLGRRRVQLLAQGAGGQLDRLEDWLNDDKLQTIQIAGMGEITRLALRLGIDKVRPLIRKFQQVGVIVEPLSRAQPPEPVTPQPAALPLEGLALCFTGTRECLKEVEALGAQIHDGVRKGTTFLVQKDPHQVTSKSKKAQQVGTRVIALDHLKQLLLTQDYAGLLEPVEQ